MRHRHFRYFPKLALLAVLTTVSACSYDAKTNISPAYNVYSNYDNKLPGKYALVIDGADLQQSVKVSGFVCSAHSYPVDARNAFSVSALKTLQNLVEEVEMVDQPMSATDLDAQGYVAMILIRSEGMDIELDIIPGFWTAKMKSRAEITAGMTVDSPSGRLLGTTVEGDESSTAEAGSGCSGGADAVGQSVEEAIKETVERLGERLSNSPRLREAVEASTSS